MTDLCKKCGTEHELKEDGSCSLPSIADVLAAVEHRRVDPPPRSLGYIELYGTSDPRS